jgi:NADPH-dependent 2,4-dienoyl-CoA reductase/sulfur reductase-like enzyme
VSGRLLVIGGDAAGMSAAAEARRADPAREIVVLERGDLVSYASCGIPYLLAGEVADEGDLVHYDPAYFRERRGIDVRTGAEAVAIDPESRRVELAGGGSVAYGALVVATGARPTPPPVPGVGLPGVVMLRDLPSARAVEGALPGARRAVIVGAGPIGVEMAEALLARGLSVLLAEAEDAVLPTVHRDVCGRVVAAMASAGVDVRPGAAVEAIAPGDDGGARLRVRIDGRDEPADLVVLGTGVAPNAEIAAGAGCALGPGGAVRVDRRGRTDVEGIWAAGDCATAHHRVLGRDVWIPLATTANAQGRAAGRDAAGRPARFPGTLGSWVSRFRDVEVGSTGVDEEEAATAGFRPRAIVREGRDRSAYMPGAREVSVRLVWDDAGGRLLGAAMSGDGAVGTRLHTLSVAISAGMTVADLAGCDLGYAPPVTPLRDPVQLAAAAAAGVGR